MKNNIGASTACLYPMNTEEALLSLAKLGIRDIEIFINCDMELETPVFDEINRIIRDYSLNVISVHPVPGWESFYLFSNYERRRQQFMDIYKRYFERMNEWGAEIMVFHGANKSAAKSNEFYFEKYEQILTVAESYGIILAQENVAYCKSGNLDFLVKMKKEFGRRAYFTLDLKQALRSGYTPFRIIDELGKNIVHIHVSDNRGLMKHESFGINDDCLPVGRGNFNFTDFFEHLREIGYNKAVILELYRENFSGLTELNESVEKLVDICKIL
ncbi:MAG: sugar phosphate isomerase/epimerase [Oscillospiraceae bacterium]|nr:sugar phosphate isomerase/epimerase [Oscillospiraceae bacterium]